MKTAMTCLCLMSMQTILRAEIAVTHMTPHENNDQADFTEYFHLNFRGDVVHSFYPETDVYFSLDKGGVFRMYPVAPLEAWRTAVVISEGVKEASVGKDFMLTLTEDHALYYREFRVSEIEQGRATVHLGDPWLVSTGVKQISAGSDHYLYVLQDGTLMGAGYDAGDGRFGANVERNVSVPIQLATSVESASAGLGFSLFLKNDGTLWGMGSNAYGNLGTGDMNPVYTPTKIANDVGKMQAEWDASWFIKNNGFLYYMGKGFAMKPVEVAGEAVQAAIDHGSGTIVWIDIHGQFITRGPFEEGLSHGWSLGHRARSLSALRRGFLMVKTGIPLFRFAVPEYPEGIAPNPFSKMIPGTRFMTINQDEILLGLHLLQWDSINFWVAGDDTLGAKPVYRLRNTKRGSYLYTIAESERASIQQNGMFAEEGIAFYAFDYPAEGTEAVYRFFSDITSSHYYTMGKNQKDSLIQNPTELNFQYEGIAFWAYGFFLPN